MKNFVCLLAGCVLSLSVLAQKIRYQFAAPNATHHEAEITVIAEGLPATPALFKMSRSSPGRYAKHEFGKNVYNVKAADLNGKALKVEKEDADIYKVSGHKGAVKLTYTLFGNYADGTYSGIDITGYHLNMPSAFMWVKGLEKAPITVQFTVPVASWRIATQLKPTNDPHTFTAPNLQYFLDAPTKIGKLYIREWIETNPDNKKYTFRLALEAEATDAMVDSFTEKLKKIVLAGKEVYGEFPAFDYGTYTFIAGINPYVHGDGMEHRNSTMITNATTFDGSDRLLGVFSHEFFHAWNVERIRPKSLEPFNFEKSNMSEALWVAEGFTQYYGNLMLVRAGLLSNQQFIDRMAGLVNTKNNTPGAQYTPLENSQRAVFVDAGISIDQNNYPNMFTSYYPYGAAIALALDLELRTRFNKTMDDVMKTMWKVHGKTEIPYTMPDVEKAIATVTGSTFYAADFFKKYIYNTQPIDYNKLFAAAGFATKPITAGKAWIGQVRLESAGTGLKVTNKTIKNTPLYVAGVDVNDVIIELDGKKVQSESQLSNILNNHKPGDKVKILYRRRDVEVESAMEIKEDPAVKLEALDAQTAEQQQFFESWIGNAKI